MVPTKTPMLELPWHKTAEIILKLHRFLLLVGDMATGKTTFALNKARLATGREPAVLPCSPETERTDVWGMHAMAGNKTVFTPGALTRALKNGSWLVAEEFGLAPLETRATLLSLRGQDCVTCPMTGEVLQIPDGFRFIATSNPENMSCKRNVGIARALYDDFQILEVPPLPTPLVRRLLANKFPNVAEERIDHVIELWDDYRQISTRKSEDSGGSYLTFRAAAHLCGLLEEGLDENQAVRVALVGKFLPDDDLHTAAVLKCDLG